MQISFAVTAKLISAFVFATRIVQFLFYLNPKFQAYSSFLRLYRLVCVGPVRKPRWFSHEVAQILHKTKAQHKLSCTATEDSYKLEISDLRRRGIVLSEVAKTKTPISFAVTAKLIRVFVFAYKLVRLVVCVTSNQRVADLISILHIFIQENISRFLQNEPFVLIIAQRNEPPRGKTNNVVSEQV